MALPLTSGPLPLLQRGPSPPSGGPDEVRRGRQLGLSSRGRSTPGRRRLAARRDPGRPLGKRQHCARGHQLNPCPLGCRGDGSASLPPPEVDQQAREQQGHPGAWPPCSLPGPPRTLLEEGPVSATNMSAQRSARGERARRAPTTPRTTMLRSTPFRRAIRSGRRTGDEDELPLALRPPSALRGEPAQCPVRRSHNGRQSVPDRHPGPDGTDSPRNPPPPRQWAPPSTTRRRAPSPCTASPRL